MVKYEIIVNMIFFTVIKGPGNNRIKFAGRYLCTRQCYT